MQIVSNYTRIIKEDGAVVKDAISRNLTLNDLYRKIGCCVLACLSTVPVAVGAFYIVNAVLVTNSLLGAAYGVSLAILGHDAGHICHNIGNIKGVVSERLLELAELIKSNRSKNEKKSGGVTNWFANKTISWLERGTGAITEQFLFSQTLLKPLWSLTLEKTVDLAVYLKRFMPAY